MWVWIWGHKTIAAGGLVFAISSAVCVSAFDRYINAATLDQRIYLMEPRVLAGGLGGIALGGAIALTSVLASPRMRGWMRQRRLINVRPWFGVRPIVAIALALSLANLGLLIWQVWPEGSYTPPRSSPLRSSPPSGNFREVTEERIRRLEASVRDLQSSVGGSRFGGFGSLENRVSELERRLDRRY